MSKKTSVISNSILYTAGNLLLKAFSFFLIPLYTSYLSTEEYGEINLASGFYVLAASLITLGLQYAIIRFYADYKNDKKQISKLLSTVIWFLTIISLLFFICCLLFKNFLTSYFFNGIQFFPTVFLSISIAIASALYTIYQDILKGMQEAKKSVFFSYVYFFLLLISNIFTVVTLRMGAAGVLLSTLLVNILMVLSMIVDLLRQKLLHFEFDIKCLCRLLAYSLPLVPHTLAFNLQNYATKVIINNQLSLTVLGIYGLASQFGMVSDVVLNSVQSAFQPWFFSTLRENDEKSSAATIKKIAYLLMWIYGLLFILIGIFSQEAVIIMADQAYISAWKYIPAIVFSMAIKAPLYFYMNFLYYNQSKTKMVFLSTMAGCAINITLTWLLTPHLHVYGSILADVCGFLARYVVVFLVLDQTERHYFSLLRFLKLVFVPMLFMFVALIPSFWGNVTTVSFSIIAYKMMVVILYCVLFLLVNRNISKIFLEKIRQK